MENFIEATAVISALVVLLWTCWFTSTQPIGGEFTTKEFKRYFIVALAGTIPGINLFLLYLIATVILEN